MPATNFPQHIKEVTERINKTGSTIPEVRKAFKKNYSFSHLPFEEQIIIWDHNWKSNTNYRARLHSFFYCEDYATKEKNVKHAWKILKNWQDYVSDWAFCDALAKIYTKHLEILPDEVFALLKKWNSDKNLWKRRQSIVSLLYYSRTKKKYLSYNQIIPLIDNLLYDKEYYVQKGVGWSLRELHNVYPEKAFLYMKKNIKNISAIAFSAATEKLNKKQKQELKDLRK